MTLAQNCASSPLLLCPEVGFDDQPVHGKVDNERSHGGIEHSTGKQLICEMDREEVGLAGPIQPATKKSRGMVRGKELDVLDEAHLAAVRAAEPRGDERGAQNVKAQ